MKIHPAAQGTLDWLLARSGIPTASEFDQLLTPFLKIRTGEMPKTYLARKLAERWLGGPLAGFMTLDMDFGKMLEEEARPAVMLELDQDVQTVGLITTNDGSAGCSPDGVIGDMGLEIKCPKAETHVKYLLSGVIPPEYVTQVHGGLWVTGWQRWMFVSYCRRFPMLKIIVERDEETMKTIGQAVEDFTESLEQAWQALCRLNGGPPRRPKAREEAPVAVPTTDDVVP